MRLRFRSRPSSDARRHDRGGATEASGDCDRHCLLVFLTEYTEALTDNNLARLAVAPTVRITSNGQVVELGKGQVWGASRRLPYRQTFVDPLSGAAVFYGIVTTTSRPARGAARPAGDAPPEHSWFYVVRLRVELQRITEVEEVSYEPPQGGFGASPSSLSLPRPDLRRVAPTARARLPSATLRHREQVLRRGVAQDRLPRCAVASGVSAVELGVFTVNSERSPRSAAASSRHRP